MTASIRIAPSILTADLARLGEQVQEAEAAGADLLHVDVMDGHFVPPITFGPLLVEAARRSTTLPLEVHLMVEHPERHLEAFAAAGAQGLIVHLEACPHLHRTVGEIKALGARAGVAINPGTPAALLEPLLADLDVALVMSVNPGWGGQRFIDGVVPKMRFLRDLAEERGLALEIEADGGVTPETAPACVRAGCTVLVAGATLYNDRAPVRENMARLRSAVEAALRV